MHGDTADFVSLGWEYFLQPMVDRNSSIEILQLPAVVPHELGDTLFSVVTFLMLWGIAARIVARDEFGLGRRLRVRVHARRAPGAMEGASLRTKSKALMYAGSISRNGVSLRLCHEPEANAG